MLFKSRFFALSNQDLILWSKKNVLVHQFKDDVHPNYVELKSIEVKMFNHDDDDGDSEDDQDLAKSKVDKIYKVISSGYKFENPVADEPLIVILIKLKNKEVLTIVYNLYRDREVSWHQGNVDTEILFDNLNFPYSHENDIGIF